MQEPVEITNEDGEPEVIEVYPGSDSTETNIEYDISTIYPGNE